MEKLLIGKGAEATYLLSNKINQHGLITGATGTGKTVSLKVLCEYFSAMGVPTILSDVKGDLANLCKPGTMNDKLRERLDEIGIENFTFRNYPINLWDVYGEYGLPLRVTISEMGPLLLSRILNLNDTQTGVLSICFRAADENGYLLLDLKDLRSMLSYLYDNSSLYSKKYGNVSKQSIAAIQRKLLSFEDHGGGSFFGEPSIQIADLLQRDSEGNGMINILAAQKLINYPLSYSTFLLWLLSEIYETFPEVGNPDVPKLVFFFDEAHLLFDNMPKILEEKIQQVVRLIRSKGVGIFFITQNPLDVPEEVSSQLGNRIIHQLRAYSPKELKAVKTAAATFRPNPAIDVKEAITTLRTGEALVSFLMEDGAPSPVEKALIMPPHSSFEPLSEEDYRYLITNSSLYDKYIHPIDRESAYEILETKVLEDERQKALEERLKELEKQQAAKQRTAQPRTYRQPSSSRRSPGRPRKSPVEKSVDSFLGTMSRSIGRELARGLFGSLTRKK